MLKRNDLVKQFELVVKQEIINHNQQIEQSNSSINELRKQIESIKFEQDKANNAFASQISQLNANCTELSKNILSVVQKLTSALNDLSVRLERDVASIEELRTGFDLLHRKHLDLAKQIQSNSNSWSDHARKISKLEAQFPMEIERSEDRMLKTMDRIKENILNRPSEAQLVKSQLEKVLASQDIDFQGVMTELKAIKKQAFILEKNQENIYTQIQRVKEGKK